MTGRFEIVADPSATDVAVLEARINEFNYATTGYRDGREIGAFERAGDGSVVAGIYGWSWGGFAEVRFLWVHDSRRHRGAGQALLEAFEDEAVRRGCTGIVLATHTFQAPGFYGKLGYREVGRVEGYPRGHAQLWFLKSLDARHGT